MGTQPLLREIQCNEIKGEGVNRNTTNVSPFPGVGTEIVLLLLCLYRFEVASREDVKSQGYKVSRMADGYFCYSLKLRGRPIFPQSLRYCHICEHLMLSGCLT